MLVNIRRHGGSNEHYSGPKRPSLEDHDTTDNAVSNPKTKVRYMENAFYSSSLHKEQPTLFLGWHEPPDCLKPKADPLPQATDLDLAA